MTDTRKPKPCHRDRHLDERIVTGNHRDDCPIHDNHPEHCPGTGGRGCAPCTAPHCVLCRTRHLDNDHPVTCPTCIGRVRTDLTEILWFCRHLRWHATRAGHDGRLLAAAPIPGGDALVLYARAGAYIQDLTWTPFVEDDHHRDDVVPVLLPLAAWDTSWRTHFGHQLPARPSVAGIIGYLAGDDLGRMAQTADGPDWEGFAGDMAALRRQLEAVLHDESDPEQGVSCFECGQRLVRKFGKPQPCRHSTPARRWLTQGLPAQRAAAREWLLVMATYPELGEPSHREVAAARRIPSSAEESAARVPCEKCTNQGGIENPAVGQSWECTGCRKHYTPGEYANAVRADLQMKGPDGDGWTFITMAAEAVSTQTGLVFPPATVRRWMDRGKVTSCCRWSAAVDGGGQVPGPKTRGSFSALVAEWSGKITSVTWGQRLVYWPDVADEAAAALIRHYEVERKRAERAAEARRFYAAIDKLPEEPTDKQAMRLGKTMGIHPSRVRAFIDERDAANRAKESA